MKINSRLRVLEYTFEHTNELRLMGATRLLREEFEHLNNWFDSVQGSSGTAHPRRVAELNHYAAIYRNNIVKHAKKLKRLLKERPAILLLKNVSDLMLMISNLDWVENILAAHVDATDLRSIEDFTTMYSLNVNCEVVLVGSLGDCEQLACNASDPIFEVTCRKSNYEIANGMFVISVRDIAETKRYR